MIGMMMIMALTQASFAQDITIEVNDEVVEFESQPVIINDRTMVPIKFVMDTLGYSVKWLEATRQVEITRGPDAILLTIDDEALIINGKEIISDVAPMIIEDRTYVPLAIIAEATGADVLWDGDTRSVMIHEKIDYLNVFYGSGSYKSYTALGESLNQIDQLSYAWSRVQIEAGQVTLNKTSVNNNSMFIPEGHELVMTGQGSQLLNIYADGDYDIIFAQSEQLLQIIKTTILSPTLDQPEFDGVVIDFESLPNEYYDQYVNFLVRLKEEVPFMTLDVALQPRGYDLKQLLEHVDHVILMLHDYEAKNEVIVNFNQSHVVQETASVIDIKQDLDNLLEDIEAWERHKILLQINLAVVQWQGDTIYEVKRYTPTYHKLIDRFDQLTFDHFKYDEQAKQPYVHYEADGFVNTIWYENEVSVMAKIKLIHDYDLGGLSLWQLGNLTLDLEQVPEEYQLNIWQKIIENVRSID